MTGLLDTGPWLAYLVRRDAHHGWAARALERYTTLLTCEAVVSEVAHLLRRHGGDASRPLAMLAAGVVRVDFSLADEQEHVLSFMKRFPRAALADACLVRMSERFPQARVCTTDATDFSVYRKHRTQPVPFDRPA